MLQKLHKRRSQEWKLAQLVTEVDSVGIAMELVKTRMVQLVRFVQGLVDVKKKHLLVIYVMEQVK